MKLNAFAINFLFQILICYSSFAQIELSQFDNITHYHKEDGLSSDYTTDVLEDKYGLK